MQRLASVDPATATGPVKTLLDGVKAKIGMVPNMYRLIAQSPAGLEAVLAFSGGLAKGALDGATRERIALAVANVNGCDYCNSAHTVLAGMHKLDAAEIAANRQGHSKDPRLDAAVAFARKVAVTRAEVSKADLKTLEAAGFSAGEIVEIVLNVAVNVLTNYVNEAFKTEIDFPRVAPAAPAA